MVIAPMIIVLVFACGAMILVLHQEQRAVQLSRESRLNSAVEAIERQIDSVITTLDGVEAYWRVVENTPTEGEFALYAGSLYERLQGVAALQWVDPEYVVRYAYPPIGPNIDIIGFDNKAFPNRLEPIKRARETRRSVSTLPIFLAQGFPGVVIFHPIYRGEDYLGTAVAVVRLSTFFEEASRLLDSQRFDVVYQAGSTVFGPDAQHIFTQDGLEIMRPGGGTQVSDRPVRIQADESAHTHRSFAFVDQQWDIHLTLQPAIATTVHILAVVTALFIAILFVTLIAYYIQRREIIRIALREREFISLVSHQLKPPPPSTGCCGALKLSCSTSVYLSVPNKL